LTSDASDTATIDVEMDISNYIQKQKNEFSAMLKKYIEDGDKNTHKTNAEIIAKLREVISIMRPLTTIYNVERFYLAENEQIELYIDTFSELSKYHEDIFKYIFRIKKVLPIQSSNGKVFILKSLTPELKEEDMDIDQLITPQLLVKVALSGTTDPISYEYYVGLTLNKLRIDENVQHFTIMYGKFFCGLNPEIDASVPIDALENMNICDNKFNRKVHLLYEYIRNFESETTMSLGNFIEMIKTTTDENTRYTLETQLIKIMILIFHSLQIAQDKLEFTHYDLHPGNILIVKLDYKMVYTLQYKNNNITIETEYVPHIIDYGRSHIKPSKAISDREDLKFMDDSNNILYDTFENFQKMSRLLHIVYRETSQNVITSIENRLHKVAYRYLYNTEPQQFETYDTLEFKKLAFKVYYDGTYHIEDNKFIIDSCDLGVNTSVFNRSYDLVRVIKMVAGLYKTADNLFLKDTWVELDSIIDDNYPYMDEVFYSMVSPYENNPMRFSTYEIKSPIDVCKWLDGRML
jgi:hypothetical protein